MASTKQNIYFRGSFKEHVTSAIMEYIKMLPFGFWGQNINVNKDEATMLISISDGRRTYMLYEHEILGEIN